MNTFKNLCYFLVFGILVFNIQYSATATSMHVGAHYVANKSTACQAVKSAWVHTPGSAPGLFMDAVTRMQLLRQQVCMYGGEIWGLTSRLKTKLPEVTVLRSSLCRVS